MIVRKEREEAVCETCRDKELGQAEHRRGRERREKAIANMADPGTLRVERWRRCLCDLVCDIDSQPLDSLLPSPLNS